MFFLIPFVVGSLFYYLITSRKYFGIENKKIKYIKFLPIFQSKKCSSWTVKTKKYSRVQLRLKFNCYVLPMSHVVNKVTKINL